MHGFVSSTPAQAIIIKTCAAKGLDLRELSLQQLQSAILSAGGT